MKICFAVPGFAVGKGRHRSRIAKTRDGRQFIANYTPKETVSYENLVRIKAADAMDGRAPFAGPAALTLYVFISPPTSWSRKKHRAALAGEIYPTTKPDLDNIEKAVCDAMNGVVWVDDKQVVTVRKTKRYSVAPEVVVEVEALGWPWRCAPRMSKR